MVCSRGESLTTRKNQMKFKTKFLGAAVALVGLSATLANPVPARQVMNETANCRFDKAGKPTLQMTCNVFSAGNMIRIKWADGAIDKYDIVGFSGNTATLKDGLGATWWAEVKPGSMRLVHELGDRQVFVDI